MPNNSKSFIVAAEKAQEKIAAYVYLQHEYGGMPLESLKTAREKGERDAKLS